MEGSLVYAKSTLGQASYATGGTALTQQERTLLIMIDGRKSVAELRKFSVVIGDCNALIERLLASRIIELVATAPRATPISPTATTQRNEATREQFEGARRIAIRLVNDLLGPEGEGLARRIEACKTENDLRKLLDAARSTITNARGATAAHDFMLAVNEALPASPN